MADAIKQRKLARWSVAQERYYPICGVLAPGGGVCEREAGHDDSFHFRRYLEGDPVPAPTENQDAMISWMDSIHPPRRRVRLLEDQDLG